MKPNNGRGGVLVLDSNSQCALSVIQSLGRRGVPVTAGGHPPRSLGMRSRYSDEAYLHPDPDHDREAFIRDLIGHLEQSNYFAVFPIMDHTCVILARNKAEIETTGTIVAGEDWETFERAYDKATLFKMAADLDIPTPETYAPSSISAVEELADDIRYPVVIKPRSKTHLNDNAYTVTLVTDENYAGSPEELIGAYRRIVRHHDCLEDRHPLVQEYVPGTTKTTVALTDSGDAVAYFQEERLRTHPSSGGNSALLAAVREPTMLEYAERVLDLFEWTGPAMVEFMETPDGEFYLIEVNGRYWGSLPFAIAAGVDFPWLHYLQLHDHDPSAIVESGNYRTDIVQRRLLYEDLKWLGENLSKGNAEAIVPFLAAFRRTRHTFFHHDDPVPTVYALLQATQLGGQAALRRASGYSG